MKALGLMLVLLAGAAFAQPVVTRGGALKKRQYQTYSDLTLYVDPTGSDTGACTSSGTGACATFQGIFNKLPRIIQNNVTVNVAAGSYSFSSRWDGAQWAGNKATPISTVSGSGVSVTFDGPALAAYTPTTGSSSGTLTGASITSSQLPTITDSTQSWTTDELRGRFVTMTSGSASGESQVIVSNTATTITTTGWSSNTLIPAVGNTYAIQTPAAIITGEQALTSHTGSNGTLTFRRLEFTSTNVSGANPTFYSFGNFNSFAFVFSNSRVVKTAGTSQALTIGRSNAAVGVAGGIGTHAKFYVGNTATGTAYSITDSTNVTNVLGNFYAYSAASQALAWTNRLYRTPVFWVSIVGETGGAAAPAISLNNLGPGIGGGTNAWITARCPAGSTGTGVSAGTSASVNLSQTSFEVTNCGTGIALGPTSSTTGRGLPPSTFDVGLGGITPQFRCTNTTTCISLTRGSRMSIGVGYTMTGVTNEISVDGVTYTFAFINSLSPKRVTSVEGSTFELY